MPTCNECLTPCNCLVDEDGFRSGRGDTDGRRNTNVSGRGTIEDPLVIEYQMSGEYRPPAGEIQFINEATTNNTGEIVYQNPITIWESPDTTVFQFYPTGTLTALTVGNFYIAGATASFNPSNTTGTRRLGLFATDSEGESHLIAGDVQHGSASRSTILTCCGWSPGIMNPAINVQAVFSNLRLEAWGIAVIQSSGMDLTISQLKLWICAL